MSLEAAYIVPHPPLAVSEVGRGDEKKIADTIAAYREVARLVASHKPTTIVFISPHSAYYADWIYVAAGEEAYGSFAQYGAHDVSFTVHYDTKFRDDLILEAKRRSIPAGTVSKTAKELDHGLMVPLYFIGKHLSTDDYEAVSIGGSGLSSEVLLEFGRCITRTAARRVGRTVLVVSGDLSHKLKSDGPYGFDPAGPLFDEAFEEIIRGGQIMAFAKIDHQLREDAAECGLSGFIMLAGALDEIERLGEPRLSPRLLSREGPFGVGYGVAVFEFEGECSVTDDRKSDRDPLVQLAKDTLGLYVREQKLPSVPDLPESMREPAACFVTIHTASTGDLRGCIGTIEPMQESLAKEVIHNAVSAATRDPRFPPLDASELDDLKVSVDVLFPPEAAQKSDLDPQRYGVIVSQGFKRGLLLPDLEGVDTVNEQLRIACAKAGIDPQSSFDIERFEVVRHQ